MFSFHPSLYIPDMTTLESAPYSKVPFLNALAILFMQDAPLTVTWPKYLPETTPTNIMLAKILQLRRLNQQFINLLNIR